MWWWQRSPADVHFCILQILAKHGGWMRGLEIVKASNGVVARGVVYVHLHWLEEHQWVQSREEHPDEITPHGSRVYRLSPTRRLPADALVFDDDGCADARAGIGE
jgi:DNA-binding PadR family transcriptional regulator